jgi:hypothetical protein
MYESGVPGKKVKVTLQHATKSPEGELRYRFTYSQPRRKEGGGWSTRRGLNRSVLQATQTVGDGEKLLTY